MAGVTAHSQNKSLMRYHFVLSLLWISFMFTVLPSHTQDVLPASDEEIRLLISRLDLAQPELKNVKAVAQEPAQAAEALLRYYRERSSVRHMVDPAQRAAVKEKYADAGQLKRARDGVNNILYSQPSYPAMQFDADIDWFTNKSETGDIEWLVQLHRQYWWNDLAQAYWHTGEELYAEAWVRQFRHWVRHCPREEKSPAWRTIEMGIRAKAWTSHYQHFLQAPAFSARDLVLFLNSCWEHAEYLANGREFTKGNWGLMEAEGAAFIAMTFPEFAHSAAWRQKAFDFLANQINIQVRPDGHQIEQSLIYHRGCIDWFANTAKLAKLNGQEAAFPAEFWQRLEAMCEVFLKLGLPDGYSTQFGDDHSSVGWRSLLREWGEIFDRADFRYLASDGAAGAPPAETAFALKDSGFYSMRSGWKRDAICLVLKNGLDGGYHSQPDNNTFELYAGGRRLMPDSGTYIYSGNAEAVAARNWFRQTAVHQTVTLNGGNTLYRPTLLQWLPGENLTTLVVENAGYPDLTHRRAVLFVEKSFFVIIDEALGAGTGAVDAHFQLLPNAPVVDAASFSFRTAFPTGDNVLVQAMPQEGLVLETEEGWVSYKYLHREQRPAFRYRLQKNGAAGVRFVTLVIPFDGPTPPAAEIRLLDPLAPGSPNLSLTVRVGDIERTISYDLGKQ